jgi:hypothetical protein
MFLDALPVFRDVVSALYDWWLAVKNRPGIIGSFLLHGLVLLLVLVLVPRDGAPINSTPFVPVDIVQLSEETTAPTAFNHAAVPQDQAAKGALSAPRPEGVAPNKTREPRDELDIKLKKLAQLRRPTSDLKIDNEATSDVTATSNDTNAGPAVYGIRDYVRSQILRHWVYDFRKLGGRNVIIPLHVELTGQGIIIQVEIMDEQRYATDPLYRDVAISARNAALLSSPIKLPYDPSWNRMDFTFHLSPRNALR